MSVVVGFSTACFSLGPAGSSITLQSGCFERSVGKVAFFYRNSFQLQFGNKNKFLFVISLGLVGYSGIGNLLKGFNDRGIEVLYIDKAFCRINFQSSGRIVKIRTVESMIQDFWINSQLKTFKIWPLYSIYNLLRKRCTVYHIHLNRELRSFS